MQKYAEGGLNISPLTYVELSPAFEGSGRIAEGRRVELQNAETDVGYFFLDRIYRIIRISVIPHNLVNPVNPV